MIWPVIREFSIRILHKIHDALNYPVPPRKRKTWEENRNEALNKRIVADKQREILRADRRRRREQDDAEFARKYEIYKSQNASNIKSDLTCPHCKSICRKKSEAKNDASGCFLAIVGLVLTPALIGIPILIYALIHGSKVAKYWCCTRCGSRFPCD